MRPVREVDGHPQRGPETLTSACAMTQFTKGDERARAAGRKGGQTTAAQRRQATGPDEGTILDVMEAAGLVGPSWATWRVFLKAVLALPMTQADLATYGAHTERDRPPAKPVGEAYASATVIGGAFTIFPPLIQVVHTRTRRRTPSDVMILTV